MTEDAPYAMKASDVAMARYFSKCRSVYTEDEVTKMPCPRPCITPTVIDIHRMFEANADKIKAAEVRMVLSNTM